MPLGIFTKSGLVGKINLFGEGDDYGEKSGYSFHRLEKFPKNESNQNIEFELELKNSKKITYTLSSIIIFHGTFSATSGVYTVAVKNLVDKQWRHYLDSEREPLTKYLDIDVFNQIYTYYEAIPHTLIFSGVESKEKPKDDTLSSDEEETSSGN